MTRAVDECDSAWMQAEITKRTGLSFAGSRGPHLASIVEGMLGAESDPTPGPPGRRPGDEAAFEPLYEALTVQESFFFREASRLALIREHVLPWVRERRSPVRVWSAGCARGEEAYTLSMMLHDAGLVGRYQVLGTDLSARAVASAERGAYGRWAVRGLDEKTVASYFDGGPRELRVADRYRSKVTFAKHNLLDPLPSGWGQFDLILCRNVLIYFTPEAVRRAAEALTAALAPGGWLLLGVSDPPLEDVAGLEKVSTARGSAYRRRDSPPATAPGDLVDPAAVLDAPAPSAVAPRMPVPIPTRTPAARAVSPSDLVAAAEKALALADAGSAVDLASQALDSAPREPAVHRLMIQALAEDGRTRESLAAAARAVSMFPDDPGIRALQAVVLLETGQVAPAMVAARQAVYLDAGSALAHVVLARTHELLGDVEAARRVRRNSRLAGVSPVEP